MPAKIQTAGLLLTCMILLTACPRPDGVDTPRAPTALERQIVKEMNRARTQPRKYAALLTQRRRFYVGKALHLPGKIPLVTHEGVAALNEAIRFLHSTSPVKALTTARGLGAGAWDHVQDQGPRGTTGHQGHDGSQAKTRASRHGQWHGIIGENITYGPDNARDVVMDLIIDDGVPNRGHRQNLFNAAFRATGVACGSHGVYRIMCVVLFAGGYTDSTAP